MRKRGKPINEQRNNVCVCVCWTRIARYEKKGAAKLLLNLQRTDVTETAVLEPDWTCSS